MGEEKRCLENSTPLPPPAGDVFACLRREIIFLPIALQFSLFDIQISFERVGGVKAKGFLISLFAAGLFGLTTFPFTSRLPTKNFN